MRGPVLAVGAVVVDGSRVVLIQRAHDPGKGSWSLPGGRVVPGERLVDALVREIREETSLDVAVERLVEVVEILGERHHYVVLDYRARVLSGELRAGDDAADARWVDVADLPSFGVTDAVLRVVRSALSG